jgi:hypothetical protein
VLFANTIFNNLERVPFKNIAHSSGCGRGSRYIPRMQQNLIIWLLKLENTNPNVVSASCDGYEMTGASMTEAT